MTPTFTTRNLLVEQASLLQEDSKGKMKVIDGPTPKIIVKSTDKLFTSIYRSWENIKNDERAEDRSTSNVLVSIFLFYARIHLRLLDIPITLQYHVSYHIIFHMVIIQPIFDT